MRWQLTRALLAHALLLATLAGCATTRYYPICILAPPDGAPGVWRTARPFLERTLSEDFHPGAYALNPAGVTIHAHGWEHRQLQKIWSSLSCPTNGGGLADDVLLRQCQEEVNRYFAEKWRSWPGLPDQARSLCAHPDEGSREHDQ
jgi:hypothetical protein